jgi:hypothetical protein
MGYKVRGKLFFAGQDDQRIAHEGLKACGIHTQNNGDGAEYRFELRELPDVMRKLDPTGYEEWHILAIYPAGITFYMTAPEGDGIIWVPMSNVIVMHSVSKEVMQSALRWQESRPRRRRMKRGRG